MVSDDTPIWLIVNDNGSGVSVGVGSGVRVTADVAVAVYVGRGVHVDVGVGVSVACNNGEANAGFATDAIKAINTSAISMTMRRLSNSTRVLGLQEFAYLTRQPEYESDGHAANRKVGN